LYNMWQFALKNILSRKLRSTLAIVGLSISIISAVCLLSVSSSIKHSISQTFSWMDGLLVMQKGSLAPAFSTITQDNIEIIRRIKGVKYTISQLYRLVPTVENKTTLMGGATTAVVIMGVDPVESSRYPTIYHKYLKEGRMLEPNDTYNVVLSRRVAERYGKHLGNNIKIMNASYKIMGLYESNSIFMDAALIVPLEVARRQFQTTPTTISTCYVSANDPHDLDRIEKEIETIFPSLDAKNPVEWANEFFLFTRRLDLFILLISSIAIIVSTIGILNTMLMSITERFVEFGILKANGWTKGNVLGLVMCETLYLGTLGGLIGCFVAYLAVKILLTHLLYIEPIIPLWLMLSAFVGAVIIALIGGIYPAYRAARLNPIDAIRAS